MGRKETMGVQASLNGPVDKAAVTKTAALESGIVHKTNCEAPKGILRFLFYQPKSLLSLSARLGLSTAPILSEVSRMREVIKEARNVEDAIELACK